jgi:hypothetical protein
LWYSQNLQRGCQHFVPSEKRGFFAQLQDQKTGKKAPLLGRGWICALVKFWKSMIDMDEECGEEVTISHTYFALQQTLHQVQTF